MKKLIYCLSFMLMVTILFADLDVDIPFDQNIVGPAHDGTDYYFTSEHFDVINDGDATNVTVTVSSPNLPEGWSLMWCYELNGEGNCVITPSYEFSMGAGDVLDLDFILHVVSATADVIVYFLFESPALPEPVQYAFNFSTEDALATDENLITENIILSQNYPNPFSEKTTISYELSAKDKKITRIEIYNAKGQKIKYYTNQQISQSTNQQIVWDGKDMNGKDVPNGVYLYKLSTSNTQRSRKMILLK
ncbi:MAG: T9SS type A sorting domain-containing protein [Candidatus Cloacimonetes bacterium]|nr:T9SS type A sorting domain-containing protein [Candidatus Cloacimonadota bacterium]